MAGKIGWLELYSENSEGSASFYENVFGWKIQRDPNMGDYIMFSDAGELGGGFTANVGRQTGGLYIMTDNIETSLKAVEEAGGKTVTERTLISEEIGSWASFADPAGNVMGLFEMVARG